MRSWKCIKCGSLNPTWANRCVRCGLSLCIRRITYVGHWGPAFAKSSEPEENTADRLPPTARRAAAHGNRNRGPGLTGHPMTAEGGDANAYWPSRHVQSCGGHLSDRTRSTLDSEHGGTRSGVAGPVTFPLIDRLVPWATGVCLVVGTVQYLWSR